MTAARSVKSVSIAGYASCGFHRQAIDAANKALGHDKVNDLTFGTREEFHRWRQSSERLDQFAGQQEALDHKSSPFVFSDEHSYIGGSDEFLAWLSGDADSKPQTLAPPDSFPGHGGLALTYSGSKDIGDEAFREKLTPTAFMVLRRAATEEQGVIAAKGGFDDVFTPNSTFECAACGSPLFASTMKFDCGCGWPGFYACIQDAVYPRPDKDGVRTETVCSGCGSHIGHVYGHESFRGFVCPKSGNVVTTDHRHCVNSSAVSLRTSDGERLACTFKGRIFLKSARTVDKQRSPTTLTQPWSEEAGGALQAE